MPTVQMFYKGMMVGHWHGLHSKKVRPKTAPPPRDARRVAPPSAPRSCARRAASAAGNAGADQRGASRVRGGK